MPSRFWVPGLARTDAQHLAISFEKRQTQAKSGNWSYVFTIHRDCELLLNETVHDPCVSLDSPHLWPFTIGQRFLLDEPGAPGATEPLSQSFTALRAAELRVWSFSRATNAICAQIKSRLHGNESGLVAYMPVAAADEEAATPALAGITLSTGRRPASQNGEATLVADLFPRLEEGCQVKCSIDEKRCPDPIRGVGFRVGPAPFDLPPEVVTLATTKLVELSVPLVSHDMDNFENLPSSVGADIVTYEIFEVPDPKCGYVYGKGQQLRILEASSRAVYGLSPTTLVPLSWLPLRFVPFEGTTFVEEQAMGSACSTVLRYRASGVQDGPRRSATVRIHVLRPGPTLKSVSASDLSATGTGLDHSGGLLRFRFDGPTNEPSTNPHELFEVVNGSWGPSYGLLRSAWVENGSTLLVELPGGSGADLRPNLTSFMVRGGAGVQHKADALSAPCESLSPKLAGDFQRSACADGDVLSFMTGDCEVCPLGTYWIPATVAATDTSEGDFQIASCQPCPPGWFGPRTRALSCEPCPLGHFLFASSADRTVCIPAPAGTFVPYENMTEPVSCLNGSVAELPGQSTCLTCPANADCHVPGHIGSMAYALPGHFRSSDGGTVVPCRIPDACLGGNVCATGSEDVSLGCFPCVHGWTRGVGSLREGRLCSQCPSTVVAIVTISAVFLFTAILSILLASINITSARHSTCSHPFMLKIGLGHLFMMNALSTFEVWELTPGFSQPSILRQVLSAGLAWDGMMPVSLMPLDCLLAHRLEGSPLGRLWVELVIWITLPIIFALFCFLLCFLIVTIRHPLGCLIGHWPCPKDDASREGSSLSAVVPVIPQRESSLATVSTSMTESWQSVWSVEQERYYYYNEATGVSTWQRPHQRAQLAEDDSVVEAVPSDTLDERFLGLWRLSSFQLPHFARWASIAGDSTAVIIVSIVLACPPTLRQLIAFLRCDSLTGVISETRLLSEASVVCGSADHSSLAAVTWFALLLWGLGLPAILVGLVHTKRSRLRRFEVQATFGFLFSEYESQFYFWDGLVLLRRFALVSASSMAPGAPKTLRLSMLVCLGIVSIVVQHVAEPFDNKSGLLLDELESQALKIFCTSSGVMLLGFSELMPPMVPTLLALAVIGVHVMFLIRVALLMMNQIQRSVTEGVVEDRMAGKSNQARESCCRVFGGLRSWLCERVFMFEMGIRQHQALVTFDEAICAIRVECGRAEEAVTNREQQFVAHGIAECVRHTIAESKVERLSAHFLEFIFREAFAMNSARLYYTDKVRADLAVKLGFEKTIPSKSPSESDGSEAPSTSSHENDPPKLYGPPTDLLFSQETFAFGMLAGDFQAALISLSSRSSQRLQKEFLAFLQRKSSKLNSFMLSSMARCESAVTASTLGPADGPHRATSVAIESSEDLFGAGADVRGSVHVVDLETPASLVMTTTADTTTRTGFTEVELKGRSAPVKSSEGSLGHFLAGDTSRDLREQNARETPQRPQPSIVGTCRQGHLLVLVGPSESGWICDGGVDLGSCLSGIKDFFQSEGMNRFECRACNYDTCERCHGELLKKKAEEAMAAAALPGFLPEVDEQRVHVAAEQYQPAVVELDQARHSSGTHGGSRESSGVAAGLARGLPEGLRSPGLQGRTRANMVSAATPGLIGAVEQEAPAMRRYRNQLTLHG
eukprot:TRINITY_DN62863_c0_g1_i1.p1 TRINITY_DN62863_c0_g1~~TRINITY_DN62863_c0_g1_i1.p1  ORF type:complete len:1733 (-),score=224.79 TRINITY_DN62863_c0_g1_i1:96-5084(-)